MQISKQNTHDTYLNDINRKETTLPIQMGNYLIQSFA